MGLSRKPIQGVNHLFVPSLSYSGSVDYRVVHRPNTPGLLPSSRVDSRRAIKKPVQIYPTIHKCEWEQPQGTALFVFRSSCSIPKVAQERVNTLPSGGDAERRKPNKKCPMRDAGYSPVDFVQRASEIDLWDLSPPFCCPHRGTNGNSVYEALYCQGLLRTHHRPFCMLRLFHYPIYGPLNYTGSLQGCCDYEWSLHDPFLVTTDMSELRHFPRLSTNTEQVVFRIRWRVVPWRPCRATPCTWPASVQPRRCSSRRQSWGSCR